MEGKGGTRDVEGKGEVVGGGGGGRGGGEGKKREVEVEG